MTQKSFSNREKTSKFCKISNSYSTLKYTNFEYLTPKLSERIREFPFVWVLSYKFKKNFWSSNLLPPAKLEKIVRPRVKFLSLNWHFSSTSNTPTSTTSNRHFPQQPLFGIFFVPLSIWVPQLPVNPENYVIVRRSLAIFENSFLKNDNLKF